MLEGSNEKKAKPLIPPIKTKKLEAYKDKKDREFQGIKKTLDEEYEKKGKDAQMKLNLAIQDLEYEYSEKTKEEEEKIKLEMKKIEASLKDSGKSLRDFGDFFKKRI